jgi:hypothetical protein
MMLCLKMTLLKTGKKKDENESKSEESSTDEENEKKNQTFHGKGKLLNK